MIVYKIVNKINNKVYIGQTIKSFEHRIKQHISTYQRSRVGKAINFYGKECFYFQIIHTCNNVEELNILEDKEILAHNCIHPFGYNFMRGGRNFIRKKDACSSLIKNYSMNLNKEKNKWKLRTSINKKRIHLGKFKNKEDAINYFNYCKELNKWKIVTYPRAHKCGNKIRLIASGDLKTRKYLGLFNTKVEALSFFNRNYYNDYPIFTA